MAMAWELVPCVQRTVKTAYKYENHGVCDAYKVATLWTRSDDNLVMFQTREPITEWHGSCCYSEKNTCLHMFFQFEGKAPYCSVMLNKTGQREYQGNDYLARRVTMTQMGSYEWLPELGLWRPVFEGS